MARCGFAYGSGSATMLMLPATTVDVRVGASYPVRAYEEKFDESVRWAHSKIYNWLVALNHLKHYISNISQTLNHPKLDKHKTPQKSAIKWLCSVDSHLNRSASSSISGVEAPARNAWPGHRLTIHDPYIKVYKGMLYIMYIYMIYLYMNFNIDIYPNFFWLFRFASRWLSWTLQKKKTCRLQLFNFLPCQSFANKDLRSEGGEYGNWSGCEQTLQTTSEASTNRNGLN